MRSLERNVLGGGGWGDPTCAKTPGQSDVEWEEGEEGCCGCSDSHPGSATFLLT